MALDHRASGRGAFLSLSEGLRARVTQTLVLRVD
jgi:hypothetical protein